MVQLQTRVAAQAAALARGKVSETSLTSRGSGIRDGNLFQLFEGLEVVTETYFRLSRGWKLQPKLILPFRGSGNRNQNLFCVFEDLEIVAKTYFASSRV
jgi:hypothetical protein